MVEHNAEGSRYFRRDEGEYGDLREGYTDSQVLGARKSTYDLFFKLVS